jgi:hypothetical protein
MDEPASEGSLRPAPTSILGVDVGSAFTKAALFELVEGQYRLIARAKARTTPHTHVYEGLEIACGQIQTLTGRELFAGGEPLAGEVSGDRGVEVLAIALSCQSPVRVLATNADAASAARAEKCHVELLHAGGLRDRVHQAATAAWDAIAGTQAEIETAMLYLGTPAEAGPTMLAGDGASIGRKIGQLAVRLAHEQVPGLADLAAAATEPLMTTPAALLNLTQLVASRFGLRLAIADCGASQTSVTYATPDQAGARLTIYEHPLLDIPATPERARVLHRELQAALANCVAESFIADLVVGTGALAHFGRWSEPALTLLNGIQPAGVIQFALDAAGIISQVATFARSLPDVACRIFEQDGLVGLGAAVCPRGTARGGAKALELRWRVDEDIEQQRDVSFGELVRIPISAGHKASLALYPVKQVDVGLNRPGVAATAHIDGGRVGLMVDMRDASAKTDRDPWEQALA